METWEAAYVAGIIDGEGSITLTKMHKGENRRPCLTITSTDIELLTYLHSLIGGTIVNKKNYKPNQHKKAYTLFIKKKEDVFSTLEKIYPFLRIHKKKRRVQWILKYYDAVTPRNGKYSEELLKEKLLFEENFFKI
ncbi:LAGLIDADG family homing endonuclease [Niallia sp. 03091]|uniref:LAGLIDADG family homing endonuclease n=1 Tax=unclassified Niallia TaxID=2837522 RepID=UPI004043EC26